MNIKLDCISCIAASAVNTAKRYTDDEPLRERIVDEALRIMCGFDHSKTPSALSAEILKKCSELSGCADPYIPQKDESNRFAAELLKKILETPEFSILEFEQRIRMAIAGNIIDFGVNNSFQIESTVDVVRESFRQKIDMAALRRAEQAVAKAERILYILDNCGEAVFDRLMIEPIRSKVVLCVRGGPVFNDVTRRELKDTGLSDLPARIIDTGDSTPGVTMEHSSQEFKNAYQEADLIIAKGQGNFETMHEMKKPTVFLFMAKCPVICRLLNVKMHSLQIRTVNL